jgi:hypothetical protein
MSTTGDASGRVRVDKKEFYGRQAGTERPA